jgi:hypothetical protein
MKLAAFLALAVLVTPAYASICTRHDKMKSALLEKFDEHRTKAGVTVSDDLLEIYQTRSGSTWTIVVTYGNGKTCIIASGDFLIDFTIETKGEKL